LQAEIICRMCAVVLRARSSIINQAATGANLSPSRLPANRIPCVAENEHRDRSAQRRRAASVEVVGLIVLVVILAVMQMLRWGGDISWSAR
jgi:hypothetical protein